MYWVDSRWAWTNWLCFELNLDHRPDPGTGFTPDFLILAGYLNKLRTDFDEILWVDSCGGLHDLVTFWVGSGSESGVHILDTCIQNCNADSAKVVDGFQWNFMNELPVNHRRLRLILGTIRIIFRMRYPYPDFTQILTTADFDEIWCRNGVHDRQELSKL